MNQNKQENTIAIVGIVLGGLGFLLSLIPCVGFVGVPLGVIGLILGLVAYFKARDNGDKTTLSLVALAVSVLPLVVSAFYFVTFKSVVGDFETEVKTYTNCDSLIADIKVVESKIDSLDRIIESDDSGSNAMANAGDVIKMAIKLSKMQEQSSRLDCNYQFEEVDVQFGGNKDKEN